MPDVESGRTGDHRAVGRAVTFTGLIPKFPLGCGAGKRKGGKEMKNSYYIVRGEET